MQKPDKNLMREQPLRVVREKTELESIVKSSLQEEGYRDDLSPKDALENALVETVKHKLRFERRRNSKRIRFASKAQIVGTIDNRDDLTADEIRDVWWSSPEFNGIRLGAKFVTKDVRSRDKPLVEGIEEAYARALHLACSLSDDDFDDLVGNCKDQAVYLLPWCERSLSARGLERYTSRKHRYDRTEYAQETRAAVIRLAQNQGVSSEELSVFYREYSRSALLYARFCGEADRKAAKSARNELESHGSSSFHSSVASFGSSVITTTTLESDSSSVENNNSMSFESRRDILRKSKEHSRGRMLVQQLSQRRLVEANPAV